MTPSDTEREQLTALIHSGKHDPSGKHAARKLPKARILLKKGHDWEALNRLHRKGMILNPVGKAKSVVLTDERLAERVCSESCSREWRGG